jgi:SAM-dependent methyltransferase
VLDVACGTGIVARTAADIVGAGDVVGVDLNTAMLTVAGRVRGDIDWRQADVVALPFTDETFDAVLCQMALMFFPNRAGALGEMARVTTSGGTVALIVPSALDAQAAYGPFVAMVADHAGAEAQSLLGTYFSCGDPTRLRSLCDASGLDVIDVHPHPGTANFPSVDALLDAEVKSTPLGERLSADVYERIRTGAADVLSPFTGSDGALAAPFECQVVVARRS